MREHFQHELDLLVDQLTELLSSAQDAMDQAVTALLDADPELAGRVIASNADIGARHRKLDEHAVTLLAREQPVATDLRTIVAGLRISADVARMGKLARHVAEIARTRRPASAVPVELRPAIRAMSQAAQQLVARAATAIRARDAAAARELERTDDEIDRMHDGLYQHLFGGTWQHDTATAVHVALIGRYLERYADHAVSLAHHVAFLAGAEGFGN